MKIEFRRNPDAEGIRILVEARERTQEVEELLKRLEPAGKLKAYSERGEVLLDMDEIIRIYTERRRVLVDSDRGSFGLRARLYELEERLDAAEFVRISNSEIVNRRRILHLDFSLTGTIRLILKGGVETYVSRRYVSRIRKLFESRGG